MLRKSIYCLVLIALGGCSAHQTNSHQHEYLVSKQAEAYDREADSYRSTGNEVMAKSFESKAEETRERAFSKDYDLIDLAFDLLFP
ncbi:MAG: hypothetical protein V7752_20395 [Halopseudomonas sp.]